MSTVVVTWDLNDIAQHGIEDVITFRLSGVVADPASGQVITPDPPYRYQVAGQPGQSDPLVANDSAGLEPQGTWYTVTIATQHGSYDYNVVLSTVNGTVQTLGSLIASEAQPAAQYARYLKLPLGVPAAGRVPVATGNGTQTEWQAQSGGGTGGAVSSVFGRTGAVTAEAGDYTAADVGAASAADVTAAVAAETSRAEAAESANATAITNEVSRAQAAEQTNATAISAETSRAEAAEALVLAKAANLSDLGSASTARANLGLGTAATSAATAFDPAGAAASAQTAAQAYAVARAGDVMTGHLAPAVVTLTDAATITVNAAAGNDFRVTLGGNRTMAAPANPADGQTVTFEIVQDATGSRTVTWANGSGGYSFGSGSAPTLSTAAGKRDLVAFRYSASAQAWMCLGSSGGY